MMYNNDGPRQMFKGDWKCADCGAAITELPFEPDPSRTDGLKCRDCHRKFRESRGGGNDRRGYGSQNRDRRY